MANSSVEFELVAEVKKASATVEKFAKETQKQLDGIKFTTGITAISSAFTAIKDITGPVFSAISGFLQDAVGEALEFEKANTQLAQSLKLVGDFSEDALQSFSDFADEIARVTTLQDDQVISAAALAKSYNLTNKEAKQVVKAAIELSAATGDSLNSAVEKVAKTYNGFISRELKQLVPELKTLTDTQLQAGEATRILEQRFAGTAAAARNTAGGSLTGLKNSYLELLESVGKVITGNSLFVESIKSIETAVVTTNGAVRNYDETIQALGGGTFGAIKGALGAVAREEIKKIDTARKEATSDFADELKAAQRLAQGRQKLTEGEIQERRRVALEKEKIEKDFQAIRASIESAGLSEIEKVNKDAFDKINKLRSAEKAGIDLGGINVEKTIAAIKEDSENKVLEIIRKQNAEREASAAKIRADIEAAAANPAKAIVGELSGEKPLDEKTGIAAGAGLVGSVLKGAEGAKDLVAKGLGAVADTLLPGIGGVVSQIVGVLAEGPEKVKEFIKSFVDSLPGIISNIIQSIPALVEGLLNAIPKIIQGIIEQLPKIINALVIELPKVINSFALQMPKVAISLISSLVKSVPQIVNGLIDGLIQGAYEFVDALVDALDFLGIGGGDDEEDDDKFLGLFAKGGRVPDSAKYSGDRFPARLDRGEQVFSRDLSKDLENFLKQPTASGGSQPPIQVNLQIGLQQFAKVMLEADRLGYRVRAT